MRSAAAAIGAIGGALGSLPLTAVARGVAWRVFSPPSLPGAERLMRDVKEASYLEAAVLVAGVPLAALFFGRRLPSLLENRGLSRWRAALPGLAFSASFFLWARGTPAPAALAVGAMAAAAASGGFSGRSPAFGAAALIGLFLCGASVSYQPAGPLDLFEDGQILFNAQALARGARPFVDVYPIHGWGADGGLDALLFRYFEPTLGTFRSRRAIATGIALAALAAAAFSAFESVGWGAFAFLACLAACPLLSERHALALVAFWLLLRASRRRRAKDWFLAGIGCAATLFLTLDFGMVLLAAGAAAPFLLVALGREPLADARSPTLAFGLGASAGALPFLTALAREGAFAEFLRVSLREIPATIVPIWGLPAPSLAETFRSGRLGASESLLGPHPLPPLGALVLLLAAALTVLLLRRWDGRVDPADRAAAVALGVSFCALRGVFGRADPGHRMLYGIFAGPLAAYLLFRAVRAARGRPALAASALLLALAVLRPDRLILFESRMLVFSVEERQRTAEAGVRIPGSGTAKLPREQARELTLLRRAIDGELSTDQTFFDFGNEPGLYFVLGRRPPVRYSSVPFYETEEKQREVLAALERLRPPIALLASGTWRDAFDGVSSRERAPRVAEYLSAHYQPFARVSGRLLARRKIEPAPR